MSEVVYNEDLVKQVENKYLAVNVTAKRARDINANGLPITLTGADRKKKPVAIATEELVAGKLRYEQGEAKAPVEDTPSIFSDPQDSDDNEDIFSEEILERAHDPEEREQEEGL